MQSTSIASQRISGLFSRRSLRRRLTASKRHGRAARPLVEGLEGRQLLSVGLDPTFGWGGYASPTQPPSTSTVTVRGSLGSLALQDGKIVAVGSVETQQDSSGDTTVDMYVSRLNNDGSADTSFGTNGYQTLAVSSAGVNYDVGDYEGYTTDRADVLVQPDGKIVVLETATPRTGGGASDFVVARFNANGSVDTSFGTGGFRLIQFTTTAAPTTPISASATQLALAPNGDIVAVGNANPTATGGQDFAIARLTPGGALDTSFHSTGMTTVGFDLGGGNNDTANGVVVQPDGKIVVVGSAQLPSITADGGLQNPTNIAVARLNADGSLDTSFNGTGKLNFGYDLGSGVGANGEGEGVALAGNQILIVGDSNLKYATYSGTTSASAVQDLTVTALVPNGAFDATFNGTGKYVLPLAQGGANWSINANAITVEPTGDILVNGVASTRDFSPYGNQSLGLLAELTPSGALNSTYGNSGVAFPGAYNTGDRLLVDSNGKALFVDSGWVARTTAPAPQVVSAVSVRKGNNPNAPIKAIAITLNTDVDPKLVTNKKHYRVRIGTRGRRFIRVRRVKYNAVTHTLTLILSRKISAKQAARGLQVFVKPGTIVGLDGQPFNTALPINVQTT